MKLNADLGESNDMPRGAIGSGTSDGDVESTHYAKSSDALLMPHLHQANIACGFHAGHRQVMLQALKLAKANGVTVGAHPSLPDLVNFGRKDMDLTPAEIGALVRFQLRALQSAAKEVGVDVTYIKPHGALYQQMMSSEAVFSTLLDVCGAHNSRLALMVGSNLPQRFVALAQSASVLLCFEAFADRRYQDDGHLVSRAEPGAVLSADEALAQASQLCEKQQVTSVSGRCVPIKADTLCVHGDNPSSLQVVARIRALVDSCA